MINRTEKIATIVIWIMVILTFIGFVKFYHQLKSLGDFIIVVAPAIIFFIGSILIFKRDRNRFRKAREKDKFIRETKLTLNQELIHDLITYIIPLFIIVLPFFIGGIPDIFDVVQAVVAFLAFNYLKFLYWREF